MADLFPLPTGLDFSTAREKYPHRPDIKTPAGARYRLAEMITYIRDFDIRAIRRFEDRAGADLTDEEKDQLRKEVNELIDRVHSIRNREKHGPGKTDRAIRLMSRWKV